MYNIIGFTDFSPTLGDLVQSNYPLWNDTWNTYIPEYKVVLCKKIEQYYKYNQIGAETPDRFRDFINAKLMRIMPYYNQMYESTLIRFNPMLNQSIQRSGRRIENLLRIANSGRSEIGDIIRNYANSGKTKTDFTGSTDTTNDTITEETNTGNYNKYGDNTLNETIERSQDTTNNKTVDTATDETVNSKLDHTTEETTALTRNQTDNTSGNETINETRNTTGTESNYYSDTPQENVSESGQVSVRWDYLTNARYISKSEDMDDNTSRNYSEEKTSEATENSTRNLTENNTGESTTDRDVKETENSTQEITESTTKNQTEDWREQGNNTNNFNGNENIKGNEQINNNTVQDVFSNGGENTIDKRASSASEDEKHTKDEGENVLTTGYTNISPSDLLKSFRETFINVDDMIIGELRDLFMEVF